MTTLGGKATPPVFDAKSLVASIAGEILTTPPELGTHEEIRANLLAALFQDDEAHDTCSLVACLNPLHPGPCKGWKGTLFKTAPGAWHSLEAAKVEKANATRLKKIADLKAKGLPIPKKLLTPVTAKPHPHAGTTANKASGGAHVAGKEVSANAGVQTSTPGKVSLGQAIKSLAPVEKGPKGKKPTVMSKGIAHVIAQEKVTPAYKLSKAEAITPAEWAGLSEADQATIRGELAKIKIDGFGPQQKKADELLAKLPAGASPKATAPPGTGKVSLADLANSPKPQPKLPEPKAPALKPGDPDTITTPSGKTYQKVTLKDSTPASLPEPKAPDAPEAEAKPKAAKKALFSVEYDGQTVTRTSAAEYTHASVVQQGTDGPTGVWGFHKSEANALKVPFTAAQKANGWKVVAALPVTKHESGKLPKDDKGAPGAPSASTPAAPASSPDTTPQVATTTAQAVAVKTIADAVHGEQKAPLAQLEAGIEKMKASGKPLAEHPAFLGIVNNFAQAALKKATADNMPDNPGITAFNHQIRDHIVDGKPGLPPLVAKMVAHHDSKKNAGVKDGIEKAAKDAHQAKVDAAKLDAPAAAPDKSNGVDSDTTVMTPTNLVKKIQKDGSADLIIGGVKTKVGFQGSGHEGKLTMVPGGQYVVTMKSDGTKHYIGKGEHVTVANVTAPVGPVTNTPQVPEGDAVKAIEEAAKAPVEPVEVNAAHVDAAIAMANGTAPGASWAKHQLPVYQELSGKEFDGLDPVVQDKIVSDLNKAITKFLDPKKIDAAKKLLEKFGHGDGSLANPPAKEPSVAQAAKLGIGFSEGINDPDLPEAQAKEIAAKATPKMLFIAAKNAAGLTEKDDPDNGEHIMAADDEVEALMAAKTKFYSKAVLEQPEVAKAMLAYNVAALKVKYATNVDKAKNDAFNKITTKIQVQGGKGLTPLQKASLIQYGKYLLEHNKPDTSKAKIEALTEAQAAAEKDLSEALNAGLKKANAPAVSSMSNAQVANRTVELLGDIATDVKTTHDLKEMQYLGKMGKAKADTAAGKYSPAILADPTVAAKLGQLANAYTQQNATDASLAKLDDHLKQVHLDALMSGKDKDGNPLTAEDKAVISQHAKLLKDGGSYLEDAKKSNVQKVADAELQFNAAAFKADGLVKPNEPVGLNDYDQTTVGEVYRTAWANAASKVVSYGIKGYGIKTKMTQHPQYPSLKQDISELADLAGKLAVATGHEHTAKLNIPHNEGGVEVPGAEQQAWISKVMELDKIRSEFNALHKTAQARVDAIRVDAGLAKRALPKVDSAAVKTAAAESAYYKTAGYSGPLYGKQASAKQYLVAKVGPKFAVAHKTSSDKQNEKYEKQQAEAAKIKAAMPAAKTHVKPPSSEKGKLPNPETAASLGYHYTPKVTETPVHNWKAAENPAYVASPEALADLKKHLEASDTTYGIAAQKQFKWSINNMEDKGAAPSQQKALYSYTGSGYTAVNTKLNGLPPGTKKTGSSTISSIDAAFAAAPPLEGDVILYRGFSSPETVFSSGKWNDVNVAGVEWSQRSYSSTSGELSTAQSFAGFNGVVMRVIIPKEMGIKGINAKGGQHPGENEIILERGIRYRVVADYGKSGGGAYGNDKRRYIDVMVVPNPYDKPE